MTITIQSQKIILVFTSLLLMTEADKKNNIAFNKKPNNNLYFYINYWGLNNFIIKN